MGRGSKPRSAPSTSNRVRFAAGTSRAKSSPTPTSRTRRPRAGGDTVCRIRPHNPNEHGDHPRFFARIRRLLVRLQHHHTERSYSSARRPRPGPLTYLRVTSRPSTRASQTGPIPLWWHPISTQPTQSSGSAARGKTTVKRRLRETTPCPGTRPRSEAAGRRGAGRPHAAPRHPREPLARCRGGDASHWRRWCNSAGRRAGSRPRRGGVSACSASFSSSIHLRPRPAVAEPVATLLDIGRNWNGRSERGTIVARCPSWPTKQLRPCAGALIQRGTVHDAARSGR